MERKLTAILSADVKGYSRLMGEDEEATIRTLTAYREVMTTLIGRHRGRVVDSPGDNLLAEFASVVNAVQGAVEIQRELELRNADLPHDRRMEFRIGINLGDVVAEGERIYGDGVNIAARLQEIAEPGGIVISNTVYDQVRNKLSVGFDNLGPQPMKNVAPVVSYRVARTGGDSGRASLPVSESPARPGAAPPAEPAAPEPRSDYQPPEWMRFVWDGLAKLPRPIAAALTASGFLVLINLFTNPNRIWFHWPVAALLFLAIMRTVLRRGRESDRKKDR